jgi:hypothetical protein
MPRPPEQLRLKPGHLRFVTLFAWGPGEDEVAAKKMYLLSEKLPEGIDGETFQAYYLTGERTMVVIGQAKSQVALQALTSRVTFGTELEPSVFHALEVHELRDVVEAIQGEKSSEAKRHKK